MRLAGIAESAEFVDDECTHEALKCVYNCIFLHDGVKDYFESHKGIQISCRWLQQSPLSLPVQFLLCRILFFMAVRRPDIVDLIMTCNLASPMERILNENVDKLLAEPDMDTSQPINSVTVINEALKLLFSMTVTMEQKDTKENASIDSFKRSLVPIMKLVFRVPAPKPMPMTPPLSHAIHVLMQYPYEPMHEVWMADYESFVPIGTTLKDSRGYLVDTLTRRLQDTIDYLLPTGDPDHAAHSQHYNLDAALSPIILVIRTLAHGDVSARALFAQEMLPQR
ncbi:hypothetical protein DM01DRAFT_319252 [Hesseltinella vesiculosa]|uniref:Uncharacterized protein n=1 Tax=Hesseltinella vesiculosa TaxID=101127 RepID=A0A1X2G917_9FUNG|nr:hypothetical protein DM01DRAFT_319252 [Hesseltinella vesiculosa]